MKKSKKVLAILLVLAVLAAVVIVSTSIPNAKEADPTGASYVATTGNETLNDVAGTAKQALIGANYTWIMICAFMVFFFQCGFAMVETGFLPRQKRCAYHNHELYGLFSRRNRIFSRRFCLADGRLRRSSGTWPPAALRSTACFRYRGLAESWGIRVSH